jgi:hypothetical protein
MQPIFKSFQKSLHDKNSGIFHSEINLINRHKKIPTPFLNGVGIFKN